MDKKGVAHIAALVVIGLLAVLATGVFLNQNSTSNDTITGMSAGEIGEVERDECGEIDYVVTEGENRVVKRQACFDEKDFFGPCGIGAEEVEGKWCPSGEVCCKKNTIAKCGDLNSESSPFIYGCVDASPSSSCAGNVVSGALCSSNGEVDNSKVCCETPKDPTQLPE